VDITDKLILKSNIQNTLQYFWIQSPAHMSFKNLPKSYTLSIQLVRRISIDHLVNTITKREIQVNNNHDKDTEIEDLGLMATRHRVSLICPITQALIHLPVKSSYCSHFACFDLRSFLQMNEKRLQWTCPICKKSAAYEALHVDKRLQSILVNVPSNCSTVEIDSSKNVLSDCQYILDNIKQDTSASQDEEESVPNSPIRKSIVSRLILSFLIL
jgi:E3 SUMO-protein ligase PIAS1